jgi:hypothetical protein
VLGDKLADFPARRRPARSRPLSSRETHSIGVAENPKTPRLPPASPFRRILNSKDFLHDPA